MKKGENSKQEIPHFFEGRVLSIFLATNYIFHDGYSRGFIVLFKLFSEYSHV